MAMSSNTKNQMSMSGNLKNGNVLAMSGNGKTLLGTYVAQLGLPRVTANVTSWISRRWQHVFFLSFLSYLSSSPVSIFFDAQY